MLKLLFYILLWGVGEDSRPQCFLPAPMSQLQLRENRTLQILDVLIGFCFSLFLLHICASHHIVLLGYRYSFGDDGVATGKCVHTRPRGRRPPRRTFFFKFMITRWKREWSLFWRSARTRTRLTTTTTVHRPPCE